ncbi:MAG: PEP-utilizing enzyme [Planctomycetaceae bacterium]
MRIAQGILTAFGGASSHAALVSRQMGKVCIVGCSDLDIDYHDATPSKSVVKTIKEGDWISIDGFTGEVFAGQVPTKPSEIIEVLLNKTLKPEDSKMYRAAMSS